MRLFDAGTREGSDVVSERVLTAPNVLSLLRLLILPVVYLDLVYGSKTRALIVLGIFAATDWVDGYVARRFGQVSRLGTLLDPISDRALMVVVGIGLIVADLAPWWAVVLVLARDAIVIAAGLFMLARGRRPPSVTRIGKAATFGLMFAFPLFILAAILGDGAAAPHGAVRALAWFAFWTNTVLYYVSAGQYALAVRRATDDAETRG